MARSGELVTIGETYTELTNANTDRVTFQLRADATLEVRPHNSAAAPDEALPGVLYGKTEGEISIVSLADVFPHLGVAANRLFARLRGPNNVSGSVDVLVSHADL